MPHHHHAHGRDHLGNPEDLKAYLGKLEGRDRAGWQKPEAVIRALRLRKSDVVADLGAGSGFFARRLAKRAGFVFAVEADRHIFGELRERTAKLPNVAPVFALADAPRLPEKSVDLVLMVNVFHHVDGARYLRKLARVLKPGGRIANIDFHPDAPMGPPHKISREDFTAEAKRAGLRVLREHDLLRHQYFVELAAAGR